MKYRIKPVLDKPDRWIVQRKRWLFWVSVTRSFGTFDLVEHHESIVSAKEKVEDLKRKDDAIVKWAATANIIDMGE